MATKQPSKQAEKKESDALGLLCVIGVFCIPLLLIFVFVRLLQTQGAPVWYLCIHGTLCVASVILAINLLRIGLCPAVRDYNRGRRRERSER